MDKIRKVSQDSVCHCTCMTRMGETCNHVAAAMFQVEAVPKPKAYFVQEIITDWAGETKVAIRNIESLIKPSKTIVELLENLDILSIEKIRQIEICTRGQHYNNQWYLCRKGVIIASKAHEITTKMKKVRNWGGGAVNK